MCIHLALDQRFPSIFWGPSRIERDHRSRCLRESCGMVQEGERHCISAVAFMVAGGGFEPPTFGLCDLAHLSMRVGLCLHPHGMLAIQSLRLPAAFRGLGSVLPYRSRDVGSTDFDE